MLKCLMKKLCALADATMVQQEQTLEEEEVVKEDKEFNYAFDIKEKIKNNPYRQI